MENDNGGGGHWANIVSYRECHKNFATWRGGRRVVDGCLEFMTLEGDGNPDALQCAACGCHRNFHRKEEVPFRVEPAVDQILEEMAAAPPPVLPVLAPHNHLLPQNHLVPAPAPAPAAVVDGNLGDGELDEEPEPRRRRRTRVKPEQKLAMREYAERLDWSLQGHNAEELFQFCSEIGIIPEVFKVWMRNNRRKYMDVGEA